MGQLGSIYDVDMGSSSQQNVERLPSDSEGIQVVEFLPGCLYYRGSQAHPSPHIITSVHSFQTDLSTAAYRLHVQRIRYDFVVSQPDPVSWYGSGQEMITMMATAAPGHDNRLVRRSCEGR